jgi:hypothetical protein
MKRAQGMPGARCTRSLACESEKARKHSHHRFTETFRHSLREWFTAYSALSLVTGLVCHHHFRNVIRKLDASVGASGPHGFAVRDRRFRLKHHPRPPHPAPNVRDDRDTPLFAERGTSRFVKCFALAPQVRTPAASWHDGQFAHGGMHDLPGEASTLSAILN